MLHVFFAWCVFFQKFVWLLLQVCQGWYDPKRLETDVDWPLQEIQQQEFVESVLAHDRVVLLYPNITYYLTRISQDTYLAK